MSLELVLFFVVAAVAIFSAAFMLISRNAVHSALFLVVNLACVAFFYLMLNAPFLAMIQITVYAGAIMVLFMFVIMLLGAEKLGSEPARFRWLVPVAALLTAVFLVLALFVVVQSNVALFQPVPHQPQIRVVDAMPGVSSVDVYLNGVKALDTVDYRGGTKFGEAPAGEYRVTAYPTCTESNAAKCPDPNKTQPLVSTLIVLKNDTWTTYVIAGLPTTARLIAVPTDLGNLTDEQTNKLIQQGADNTARLIAVNASPDDTSASLIKLDTADPKNVQTLADKLPSGQASPSILLPKGTYDLAWQRGTDRIVAVNALPLQAKTSQLLILNEEPVPGDNTLRPSLVLVPAVATEEAFGSPQQIGVTLLGPFLLPFELVSLLLLAAMVGAIILTREEVTRRVRQRLVVSSAVRRINSATSTSASSSAESSAD